MQQKLTTMQVTNNTHELQTMTKMSSGGILHLSCRKRFRVHGL